MTNQQHSSPVYVGRDGHVHFRDPQNEAFANSVDRYGKELAAEYPELSEQLEVAELGAEKIDKLNRFGETA